MRSRNALYDDGPGEAGDDLLAHEAMAALLTTVIASSVRIRRVSRGIMTGSEARG
jgi:hypothetical protein